MIRRFRRLRATPTLRALVRETHLAREQLVLPMFATSGRAQRAEVVSMPGVFRESVDRVVEHAQRARDLGIVAVILFGLPESKDAEGRSALDPGGVVPRALEALARDVPDLVRIVDLCFCEYTNHGHCGPLDAHGVVKNDETIALLGEQARMLAGAGASIIAPSGMMDGMVAAIRGALDQSGHLEVPILSYAAKMASGFYGPFRDAADSTPSFGDRRGYQMDAANGDEAMREVLVDIEEGADCVMVKPAMPCLDLIHRIKTEFQVPTAAYQVSGEYAMIKAAAERGWLDHDRVMEESLVAIRRAGADFIVTYFAEAMAAKLPK